MKIRRVSPVYLVVRSHPGCPVFNSSIRSAASGEGVRDGQSMRSLWKEAGFRKSDQPRSQCDQPALVPQSSAGAGHRGREGQTDQRLYPLHPFRQGPESRPLIRRERSEEGGERRELRSSLLSSLLPPPSSRAGGRSGRSVAGLVLPLNVNHSVQIRDRAGHLLQMLEVRDFQQQIDGPPAVGGPSFDVANVGLQVGD